MTCNFDQIIDRRRSESLKWRVFGEDVLPLWVADMDFASPEPVIRALQERVEHGIFGYGIERAELREVVAQRLRSRYGWQVAPEAVLFTPGVVTSFNVACRAFAAPGDGVLVQTPVYPPIFRAPPNAGLNCDEMELTRQSDGRYVVDFDRMAATITDRTRLFILCNPHNPVGRVFERAELEQMAELCLAKPRSQRACPEPVEGPLMGTSRHNIVICSDEIHCDLVFSGHQHVPIATLAPEVADRTITLMAPSKTYNIAGLHCSVAIIQNPELRAQFQAAGEELVPSVNILGFVAALAAYRDGQPWLDECLRYLEGNCDYLMEFVKAHLPGIAMIRPEGTYLAWLDCREAGLSDEPARFFLKQARVALNEGASFGRGGAGFVRLNFACPRAILEEALGRMAQAVEGRVESRESIPGAI